MKKIYLVTAFLAGMILMFFISADLSKDDTNNDRDFPQGYRIISPVIPKDLDFAGEKVPLNQFDIYERMDKEFIVNTYFHSYTILTMKRANRWFPVIEPILKKYHVPDDFKYIAVIESGLENIVSPKGAKGFWQFMPDAAKKYGLEVNDVIDERYNVEKATEAACKFFLDADTLFNSWTMAAAAFDFGVNGLTQQVQKQKSKDYYNLILGDETERYIPRAIAIKEIFKHPKQYGFDIKKEDLYLPLSYNTVNVDSSISNLADFAIAHGINYKILKLYNPWLRDNFINNETGKTYKIEIPNKVIREN
jgi:peptidoglycan lytic transglycosylase D